MKEIKVKPLTVENFKRYGSFATMLDPAVPGNGIPGMTFYADLAVLELGCAHAAAFSTTCVTDALPPVILALEQHTHCGEGILALDADMLVYFAPANAAYPAVLEQVEAFRVPKGVLLVIRPGVWHCMPFPAGASQVNVLNVLPERTYANDCTMKLLQDSERIHICEG